MQKNKSFQKTNKTYKQISNCSSRALLELSQITANSKDKSALMQKFTQRSGYPSTIDFQSTEHYPNQTTKQKQKHKSNSKKQTYLRQKAPLSNSVINQIMQISNSLPIKNGNLETSKISSSQNDLIIFSKTDLLKNKNFSQAKKTKKLLLYENKQNQEKPMSKSKSSYSQIMKVQPILCSIKIQPLQQQKNSYNKSNNQKRQSFDGRRSSFSSRRSSINLFPQDDFVSQNKIKQIKKSLLAKISQDNQIHQTPDDDTTKIDNFLKQSHLNSYEDDFRSEDFKAHDSKQTRQNETQITPRQKKQIREKYLLKLDELNVIEDDIRKDASKFIDVWDNQIQSQKNLKKYRKNYDQVKLKYQQIVGESNTLKNKLFEQNKRYVMSKKISSNNFNSQKQGILLEVQKIHMDVKKKVFKKDLQEIMAFNMKVVLPSSQLMQSSISCFDSQIHSGIKYLNITILHLYEELMNQRACKKYGMILKKEINNMNIYDNRTMNEYLKKLFELENAFNKVQGLDPQNQNEYFEKIQNIVDKIQQVEIELSHVQRKYSDLENKIHENERINKLSHSQLESLLNEISESVYCEYRLFQTGGKSDIKPSTDSAMNDSFTENDKPISEFRELVSRKYEELYNRFRQVKEEKKMIMDSLSNYQ